MTTRNKCTACGTIFSDGDAERRTEFDRSEFWGAVQVDRIEYLLCPLCKCDELDEVTVCECTEGELYADEDYCETCLREGKYGHWYEPADETVEALGLAEQDGPEEYPRHSAARTMRR